MYRIQAAKIRSCDSETVIYLAFKQYPLAGCQCSRTFTILKSMHLPKEIPLWAPELPYSKAHGPWQLELSCFQGARLYTANMGASKFNSTGTARVQYDDNSSSASRYLPWRARAIGGFPNHVSEWIILDCEHISDDLLLPRSMHNYAWGMDFPAKCTQSRPSLVKIWRFSTFQVSSWKITRLWETSFPHTAMTHWVKKQWRIS